MLEKVSMVGRPVDVAARAGDELSIAEVFHQRGILSAKHPSAGHQGKANDMRVVRAAQAGSLDLLLHGHDRLGVHVQRAARRAPGEHESPGVGDAQQLRLQLAAVYEAAIAFGDPPHHRRVDARYRALEEWRSFIGVHDYTHC